MLKKLGSDLLYLILKTIARFEYFETEGFVLNTRYLSYIEDRLSEATDEDLAEIKKELKVELSEGDYVGDEAFLKNLDCVFAASEMTNYKDSTLYKAIKESFLKTKYKDFPYWKCDWYVEDYACVHSLRCREGYTSCFIPKKPDREE